MADESMELEDGEVPVASVVNGPPSSSAAAHVRLRAQLQEAAAVLRHRGQPDVARLALGLVDADLRHAIWILNDGVRGDDFVSGDPVPFDAFRRTMRMRLIISGFQETGHYNEDVVSEAFPAMVLEAAQIAAAHLVDEPYRDGGGFGAVPASAAAVCSLEKQTFHAAADGGNDVDDDDDGVTECCICCDEFVDGGQVTVMPCPSARVHKFHTECISKWLAISNVCPLCRHQLPAYHE